MKSLLEKMMKFAGEPAQKAGDQVRGSDKAKKSSKEHPFKGRLVGDSVEPQTNMLEELSQEAENKSIEWSLAEAWAEFKEEAFKDIAERRPARKGSRPSRGHEPVPGYKEVEESAEELNVGDEVIVTGSVEHKGATGVIDSFGQDKRFVVVNLYNHGKKSFNSSDVSYNEYADSDEDDYEDEDQGFFVALGSEDDGGFIGMVSKDGGKWRESRVSGKAPYNWGGSYMGYLTPDDVMSWIRKDYGNYDVKGPFSSEEEAREYAEMQYGLDEGWGAEPAARRHDEQMAAVARVLQKYQSDPEQAKLASYMFQNNWNAQAIEKEMSGQGRYDLEWWKGRLAKAEQERGPQKDWTQMMVDKYLNESSDTPLQDREDYQAKRKALQDIQMDPSTKHDPELKAELAQRLARLNQQYSELKEMVNRVKESRGHKIIARKLADIERKPSAPNADDDAARAEQAKADYAKYVAKMKKKDPNFVPLYKMDENVPTAQTTMADKTGTNDPAQAAKVAQATQALKSATGATAPTPNIAKALDAATQGKSVGATDMKAIEPMIDVLGAAAQDPKLANQFKTLAAQAKQVK